MIQARDRPPGVTVLVILHIIIGIIAVFTGLLLFVDYARPSSIPSLTSLAASIVGISSNLGVLILGIGGIWFVLSAFSFVLAYALWTGLGWSWTTSLVLTSNGLLVGGLGLLLGSWANAMALVVYGVILIYLFTRNVRVFFGRIPVFSASYLPLPVAGVEYAYWSQPQYSQTTRGQPYYPRSQQSSHQFNPIGPMGPSCPICRTMSPYNSGFCTLCGTRLT
jgi:hypothetical protein